MGAADRGDDGIAVIGQMRPPIVENHLQVQAMNDSELKSLLSGRIPGISINSRIISLKFLRPAPPGEVNIFLDVPFGDFYAVLIVKKSLFHWRDNGLSVDNAPFQGILNRKLHLVANGFRNGGMNKATGQPTQFCTFNPGTRRNSLSLFVTRIMPPASA